VPEHAPSRLADDLTLLSEAAREAGSIAMRYFRRDPKVWYKEGNSPVSEADYAADDYLKRVLTAARPDYRWISEETPPDGSESESDGRCFVVDPIDGTRAYLRGEDVWCVSIAVVEAGRPIVGAIHVPVREETFEVTVDGPPLLNGMACTVSAVAAGQPMRLSVPDGMRRRMSRAQREGIVSVESIPSLAYRLSLVASGRLDGTLVRPRANDWDLAAADLLLQRAGGLICDDQGHLPHYGREGGSHGLLVAGALGSERRLRDMAREIAG